MSDLNEEDVRHYINILEGKMTARRIREAILGTDNGWLAAREKEIEELRQKLA